VISASGASSKWPRSIDHTCVKWRAESAEGVPPPKNTEVKRRRVRARRAA
jgi:hypothetical protein